MQLAESVCPGLAHRFPCCLQFGKGTIGQPVCVSGAIGSTVCEGCIVLCTFIFTPFGVVCKESVLVGAFANVGGT